MSASTSHDGDIEAQIQMDTRNSESPSSNHSYLTPREINEGGHHDAAEITRDKPHIGASHLHYGAPSPTDGPRAQSGWKPLRADELLFTKIPESKDMKETWVKAMGKADDGMCRAWKDQIDTLIIFAGLFSATVTAFTIESYQWLDETPANTLARLQLRDLLNTTQGPVMDRLAPGTFHVSSTSVAINTLWFASLTLSLAAVVVSILCKQWLYEYQRYDNFTLEETFLIRGLRHRGLQAWKVPQIISFLPILLQTALVLFLVGILILLWSLQTVVALFTTLIIGAMFIFLVVTTILPSIQYIFPTFETQCAYKSSQSWSFFAISAFWVFDLNEFTGWGSIDQWEIYNIDNGMGRTLSWVYQSFRNNFDSFLNLYTILVDKSLKPTQNGDLAVLHDFIDELSTSGPYKLEDVQRLSKKIDVQVFQNLGRISQLRFFARFIFRFWWRQKTRFQSFIDHQGRSDLIKSLPKYSYHPQIQSILYHFLQFLDHDIHQGLFSRSVEHWARGLKFSDNELKENVPEDSMIHIPDEVYEAPIPYEPEIAKWLIGFHNHLFRESWFPPHVAYPFIARCYPKLMESHHRHELDPSPVTLLKHMQEWVNQAPESSTKYDHVQSVLLGLSSSDMTIENFASYHTSDVEKEYLISFIRFIADSSEKEEFQQALDPDDYWHEKIPAILASLRKYLDENASAPP